MISKLYPPSGPNSFNGYKVFAKVFVDINVSGESITLLTVKFDKHVVILFNIVNPDIYNDVFIDVPPVLCFLKLK